jgi:hypothetical protein
MAAEDFAAHFAMGDEVGDVGADAAGFEVGEVLGHGELAAAAIASDQRGTPLADVVLGRAVFLGEDRFVAVAMVVQVDESGRDCEPGAVDGLADLAGLDFADGDDLVAANGDVAANRWAAGPSKWPPARRMSASTGSASARTPRTANRKIELLKKNLCRGAGIRCPLAGPRRGGFLTSRRESARLGGEGIFCRESCQSTRIKMRRVR